MSRNAAAATAITTPNPRDYDLTDDQEKNVPQEFCCSITQLIMRDPVIAADGHTYEREAITQWFEHHDTSPMTGECLEDQDKVLRSNHQLRSQIWAWVDRIKQAERMTFNDHLNTESSWFSYPELLALQEQNKNYDRNHSALHGKTVLFLGASQSGKSTLINYLLGALYDRDKKLVSGKENAVVGTGFDSETTLATVYRMQNHPECWLADTPGFFDDRGNMQRIMTTLSLEKLTNQMQICGGIVFVVDYFSLASSKADAFMQLAHICCDLLNLTTADQPSVLFAFTKATPDVTKEKLLENLNQFAQSLQKKIDRLATKPNLTTTDHKQKENCMVSLGLVRFMLLPESNILLIDPTNAAKRNELLSNIIELSPMHKNKLKFDRYDHQRVQFDALMHRLITDRLSILIRCNTTQCAIKEIETKIKNNQQAIADLSNAVDLEQQENNNARLILECRRKITEIKNEIQISQGVLQAADLDQETLYDTKTMTQPRGLDTSPSQTERLRYHGAPFERVQLIAATENTVLQNNPSEGIYEVSCYAPSQVNPELKIKMAGCFLFLTGCTLSIFTLGAAAAPIAVTGWSIAAAGSIIGDNIVDAAARSVVATLQVYVKNRHLPVRAAVLLQYEELKRLNEQTLAETQAELAIHEQNAARIRNMLTEEQSQQQLVDSTSRSYTDLKQTFEQEIKRLTQQLPDLQRKVEELNENLTAHQEFFSLATFVADHLTSGPLLTALIELRDQYGIYQRDLCNLPLPEASSRVAFFSQPAMSGAAVAATASALGELNTENLIEVK